MTTAAGDEVEEDRNIVFSYPEWQVSLGLEMEGVHYSNNFLCRPALSLWSALGEGLCWLCKLCSLY